jgi:hypothetical protein
MGSLTDLTKRDEEFAARINNTGDPEGDHSAADEVLLEALRAAGYNKTADAWERESGGWWWA